MKMSEDEIDFKASDKEISCSASIIGFLFVFIILTIVASLLTCEPNAEYDPDDYKSESSFWNSSDSQQTEQKPTADELEIYRNSIYNQYYRDRVSKDDFDAVTRDADFDQLRELKKELEKRHKSYLPVPEN